MNMNREPSPEPAPQPKQGLVNVWSQERTLLNNKIGDLAGQIIDPNVADNVKSGLRQEQDVYSDQLELRQSASEFHGDITAAEQALANAEHDDAEKSRLGKVAEFMKNESATHDLAYQLMPPPLGQPNKEPTVPGDFEPPLAVMEPAREYLAVHKRLVDARERARELATLAGNNPRNTAAQRNHQQAEADAVKLEAAERVHHTRIKQAGVAQRLGEYEQWLLANRPDLRNPDAAEQQQNLAPLLQEESARLNALFVEETISPSPNLSPLNQMVFRILNPAHTQDALPANLAIPAEVERAGRDLLSRREKLLELMDAEQQAVRQAAQGPGNAEAAARAEQLGILREAAEQGYRQAYKAFNKELVDELFEQEQQLAGNTWDEPTQKEKYKRIVVRTTLPCVQKLDQEFEQMKRERLTVRTEKEKGRMQRLCEWYAKLPQYKRIALGAAIGTGVAVSTIAIMPWASLGSIPVVGGWLAAKGAAIAAGQSAMLAQGAAGYLGYKAARAGAGAVAGGGLRGLFDRWTARQAKRERRKQETGFKEKTEREAQRVLAEAGEFFGATAEAMEKRDRIVAQMIRDAQENSGKLEEINQKETGKKTRFWRGLLLGAAGGFMAGALVDAFVFPRIANAEALARAAVTQKITTIQPDRPTTALPTPPLRAPGSPIVPTSGRTLNIPTTAHANIAPPPVPTPDMSGLPGPAGRTPGASPLPPAGGRTSPLAGMDAGLGPGEPPFPAESDAVAVPDTDIDGHPLERFKDAGRARGMPSPEDTTLDGHPIERFRDAGRMPIREILPEHGVPLAGPRPGEVLPETGVPLAGPGDMPPFSRPSASRISGADIYSGAEPMVTEPAPQSPAPPSRGGGAGASLHYETPWTNFVHGWNNFWETMTGGKDTPKSNAASTLPDTTDANAAADVVRRALAAKELITPPPAPDVAPSTIQLPIEKNVWRSLYDHAQQQQGMSAKDAEQFENIAWQGSKPQLIEQLRPRMEQLGYLKAGEQDPAKLGQAIERMMTRMPKGQQLTLDMTDPANPRIALGDETRFAGPRPGRPRASGQPAPSVQSGIQPPIESAGSDALNIGTGGPQGAFKQFFLSTGLLNEIDAGKLAQQVWDEQKAHLLQELKQTLTKLGYTPDQDGLLAMMTRIQKGGLYLDVTDPKTPRMRFTDDTIFKGPLRPRVSDQPVGRPRRTQADFRAGTQPTTTRGQTMVAQPPTGLRSQGALPPIESAGGSGRGVAEVAEQVVDHTRQNMRRYRFVGHFADQAKTMAEVDAATYLAEVKRLVAQRTADVDSPLVSSILPDAHNPGYLDHYERFANDIEKTVRKNFGGRIPSDFGKDLPMKTVLKELEP